MRTSSRRAAAPDKENSEGAASRAAKLKAWRERKATSRKPPAVKATSKATAAPRSGARKPAATRSVSRPRRGVGTTTRPTSSSRRNPVTKGTSRATTNGARSQRALSRRTSPKTLGKATATARASSRSRGTARSRVPPSAARVSRGASASAASKPTQPAKKKRRGAPKDERLDTKNNAERLLRLALIPSIEEALMYKQINQPQKAREAFQRILDSPELPEARRKAVYWVARARFEEDEGELADAVALYEEGFKYTQSPWERDTLEKGLRNFVLRLSMKGQTPNIDALLKSPSASDAVNTANATTTPNGVSSLPTPELAKRLSFSAILSKVSNLVRGSSAAEDAAPAATATPEAEPAKAPVASAAKVVVSTSTAPAPVAAPTSSSPPPSAPTPNASAPPQQAGAAPSAPRITSAMAAPSPRIPTGTVSRLKALWEGKSKTSASEVPARRSKRKRSAAPGTAQPASAPVPPTVEEKQAASAPSLPASVPAKAPPASPCAAPAPLSVRPLTPRAGTPRSLGPAARVPTPRAKNTPAASSPDASSPDAGLLCFGDGVEVDMFGESDDLFAGPGDAGVAASVAAAASPASAAVVNVDTDGNEGSSALAQAAAAATPPAAEAKSATPAQLTPKQATPKTTPRRLSVRGSARRVRASPGTTLASAAAAAAAEAQGSVVVTEVLKASKRTAAELGSDFFLSPVRRSARVRSAKRQRMREGLSNAVRSANPAAAAATSGNEEQGLSQMLEAANYAYRPNAALLHPVVDLTSNTAANLSARQVKLEPGAASASGYTYSSLVAHTAGASPAPHRLGPPTLEVVDLAGDSSSDDGYNSGADEAGSDELHRALNFSFNSQ